MIELDWADGRERVRPDTAPVPPARMKVARAARARRWPVGWLGWGALGAFALAHAAIRELDGHGAAHIVALIVETVWLWTAARGAARAR